MSLIIDFLRKSLREEIFCFFSGYFIINFSRMCLRDQIIGVLFRGLYFTSCAKEIAGSNVSVRFFESRCILL